MRARPLTGGIAAPFTRSQTAFVGGQQHRPHLGSQEETSGDADDASDTGQRYGAPSRHEGVGFDDQVSAEVRHGPLGHVNQRFQ